MKDYIASAAVTFSDNCESYILKTIEGSECHFFEKFKVGDDYIQLRLDWTDLDYNGHPTLDADFIDCKTGSHRPLKGKRKEAHHTTSSSSGGRCYEWVLDDYCRQFSVAVEFHFRASISASTETSSVELEVSHAEDSKP